MNFPRCETRFHNKTKEKLYITSTSTFNARQMVSIADYCYVRAQYVSSSDGSRMFNDVFEQINSDCGCILFNNMFQNFHLELKPNVTK